MQKTQRLNKNLLQAFSLILKKGLAFVFLFSFFNFAFAITLDSDDNIDRPTTVGKIYVNEGAKIIKTENTSILGEVISNKALSPKKLIKKSTRLLSQETNVKKVSLKSYKPVVYNFKYTNQGTGSFAISHQSNQSFISPSGFHTHKFLEEHYIYSLLVFCFILATLFSYYNKSFFLFSNQLGQQFLRPPPVAI